MSARSNSSGYRGRARHGVRTILATIINDLSGRVDLAACRFRTVPFGYLRGLDGELAPEYGASDTLAPGGRDTREAEYRDPGGVFAGVRRAEAAGAARLDYVRRLADVISGGGRDAPVAVGVLGSDVYDKLLIFQALRERARVWCFYHRPRRAAGGAGELPRSA